MASLGFDYGRFQSPSINSAGQMPITGNPGGAGGGGLLGKIGGNLEQSLGGFGSDMWSNLMQTAMGNNQPGGTSFPGLVGTLTGGAIGGPWGMLIGTGLSALLGSRMNSGESRLARLRREHDMRLALGRDAHKHKLDMYEMTRARLKPHFDRERSESLALGERLFTKYVTNPNSIGSRAMYNMLKKNSKATKHVLAGTKVKAGG